MTADRTALPDSVEQMIGEMRNFADVADRCQLTEGNASVAIRAWSDRLQSLRPAGEEPAGEITGTYSDKYSMALLDREKYPIGTKLYTRPAGSPSSAALAKLVGDLNDLDCWVKQRGWDRVSKETFSQLRDRVSALTAAEAQGDYVRVPRVPTQAMIEAAERREDDEPLSDWGKVVPASHAEIYKAMLAAAGAQEKGNG